MGGDSFLNGSVSVSLANANAVSWVTVMNTLQVSLTLPWVRLLSQLILCSACVKFVFSLLSTLICSDIVFLVQGNLFLEAFLRTE